MHPYTLPPLPYPYDALEPSLSGEVLRFHHDEHHAGYVKTANLVYQKLHEARRRGDMSRLPFLEKQLAFNLSGHVLHSIFWHNLSPDGGGEPEGDLRERLDEDFGSFQLFKQQMVETAASIMGSGWAALMWEPIGQSLIITQIHDHQSEVTQGSQPVMVLDAWEHAYYLQYQNRKAEYLEAIWDVWNWDDVAARCARSADTDMALPETGVTEISAEPM